MRTENAWKSELRKSLAAAGAQVLSLHGHGMQAPGWPDLFVASTRWRGWLELKAVNGELSTAQRIVCRRLVSVWPGGCWILRADVTFSRCDVEDVDGVVVAAGVDWRRLLEVL